MWDCSLAAGLKLMRSRCPQNPSPRPIYRYWLRLHSVRHSSQDCYGGVSGTRRAMRSGAYEQDPVSFTKVNVSSDIVQKWSFRMILASRYITYQYSLRLHTKSHEPVPKPLTSLYWHISEWIKGLLAVPFVLHSQPTGVFETRSHTVEQMAEQAHRRYAEIMQDVENMIDDHSE
jgi:hypothetical protein